MSRRRYLVGVWCISAAALVVGVALEASGRAPRGRFIVQGDTVLDNVTNLVWQRQWERTLVVGGTLASYCASLRLGGLAAGTFRAPTIKELASLLDVREQGACFDRGVFPPIDLTLGVYSGTLRTGGGYLGVFPSGSGGCHINIGANGGTTLWGSALAKCVRSR